MTEFVTRNTHYRINPLGFGLLEVLRAPRDVFRAPELVSCGVTRLLADDVTVHPDRAGGHVCEARKVVFWKDGRPVLVTSGGDSRTYLNFTWGTFEALMQALEDIRNPEPDPADDLYREEREAQRHDA